VRTPFGRRSSTLAAGAASVVLAVLAAGCGGSSNPGVASIGDTGAHPSAPRQSWAAMYHCYATHGYPKYRVINSPSVPSAPPISGWYKLPNGNFAITRAFQRLYGTAKFRAVEKVCDPLGPHKAPTPAQVAAQVAYARTVARCMRAHGMPNLPDADSGGLIHLAYSAEDNSPKFLSAEGACQSVMTQGEPFLVPQP
jgi:hypothetical protein